MHTFSFYHKETHTKLLRHAVTALVFSLGSFAVPVFAATDPASVTVLKRAEADALFAHPEQLTVIDLRRPDELTNIGGFPVYLSIQVDALAQQLAWIPKERTVVTVSNHAGRAKRGAAALIDAGFDVAGAIGAQDYEAEGGVLTKIAVPVKEEASANGQ